MANRGFGDLSIVLELIEGHWGHFSDAPLMGLNALPSPPPPPPKKKKKKKKKKKNHFLALDIFGAISRSSHLRCNSLEKKVAEPPLA